MDCKSISKMNFVGMLVSLHCCTVWAIPPKHEHNITDPTTQQSFKVTYIQMDVFENKMLIADSIGGTLAQNVVACKGKCAKVPNCVSMNVIKFNATFLRCEFFDFDHYGVKERFQLIYAKGIGYYVLKVRLSIFIYNSWHAS